MEKIPNRPVSKIAAHVAIAQAGIKSMFMPVLLPLFLCFGFTIPNKNCGLVEYRKCHKNEKVASVKKTIDVQKNVATFHPLMLISRFE